jgi:electron transport protein HydN
MPFVAADKNKCIGCKVCEMACHAWHHVQGNTVGTASGPVLPKIYMRRTSAGFVPVQCRHCEGAVCAKACPQGAIIFQNDRILVDTEKCGRCNNCEVACPLGAIKVAPADGDNQVGVAAGLEQRQFGNKCDLCCGRGQGPLCVEACPEKALYLLEPQKDKREKNIKAAESIAAIRRGR